MLKVKNLQKSFFESTFELGMFNLKDRKENNVLKGVNFIVEKNEILGLSGKNGSGKSTLLKLISGLIEKDEGEISFTDLNLRDVSLISSNERSFYWRLTTQQNLFFFGSLHGLTKKEIGLKIKKFDEFLNLKNLLDKPFMVLSSGQKKIVMLARTFIKSPKLILCDELLNFLDEESKKNVKTFITNYIKNNDAGVIWVSHSDEELNNFCNRHIKLSNGEIRN
tara:strand:- start:4332 stop:4997 length:666 start_codon:yes stop_codon:yes gene_type:complete